jgi:hypothetical protein
MRAVEATLDDRPRFISSIAAEVYELPDGQLATRAQIESVRRAAKRLAALGRAEVVRITSYASGDTSRRFLTVRRPK